jgi:lauroyl/myristoyl acyltransferase
MSARRASLIVGAVQFFVISAALAYASNPSDSDEAYPLGLVVVALVAAVFAALLIALSVRVGLLAARRNPVRTVTVLAIALLYGAVLLVLGSMPDTEVEAVARKEFRAIARAVAEALLAITFLPAAISYVVASGTRNRT